MLDSDPYNLPQLTDEECRRCGASMLEDFFGPYCDRCGYLVQVMDDELLDVDAEPFIGFIPGFLERTGRMVGVPA